jgi:hypothetical protein
MSLPIQTHKRSAHLHSRTQKQPAHCGHSGSKVERTYFTVEKYTDGIACNNHDREHFTHTFIYNSWIEIMLPVTKALPKVKVRLM